MILELPDTLALPLADRAAEEGLDVPTYVQRLIERELAQHNASFRPFPPPTAHLSDVELIEAVNRVPTATFWARYRELDRKHRALTVTPEELEELIRRSDSLEALSAERLAHLIELAKRRGVPARDLMVEMGLRSASTT